MKNLKIKNKDNKMSQRRANSLCKFVFVNYIQVLRAQIENIMQ